MKGFTIGVMGDVLAGIHLPAYLQTAESSEERYQQLWAKIRNEFSQLDLRLANLETAICPDIESPWPNKAWRFRIDPATAMQSLKISQIDYFSLANNHIFDFGDVGLKSTLEVLNKLHIHHSGAGMNAAQAFQPAIMTIEKNGVTLKLGVYSFATPRCHMSDIYDENGKDLWAATDLRSGVNYIDPEDGEAVLLACDAISQQKQMLGLDHCLVFMHWGSNYPQTDFPWKQPDIYQALAHQLVDAGKVSIIVGTSSHHAHGIECYKGATIIYGTGDFVSDYAIDPVFYSIREDFQIADLHPYKLANAYAKSFLYKIHLDKEAIHAIRLKATETIDFQVHLMDVKEEDTQKHIQTMQDLCLSYGTNIEFHEEQLQIRVSN